MHHQSPGIKHLDSSRQSASPPPSAGGYESGPELLQYPSQVRDNADYIHLVVR
jgi:hypothetical protein